ncbi:hypothetical protein AAU61_01515 [Desulfocarbo indianensis]|nr:hypothetical protein AAU61_01515 [Desulfocarbo indianensis]
MGACQCFKKRAAFGVANPQLAGGAGRACSWILVRRPGISTNTMRPWWPPARRRSTRPCASWTPGARPWWGPSCACGSCLGGCACAISGARASAPPWTTC